MKQTRLHILLVDDHRTTNILNKLLLQKLCEVATIDTAKDITEAYAQIEHNNYEIVLIDRDLLLNQEKGTLNDFKYMSDDHTLFVLLSSDQLNIPKQLCLKNELGVEEVKFKILTKHTAQEIINTFYNKIIIPTLSTTTTSASTI